MQITITWHLILMIVISIILLIGIFKEEESFIDFSSYINLIVLIVIWLIYGGIFIW